jgi:hypothetical protein
MSRFHPRSVCGQSTPYVESIPQIVMDQHARGLKKLNVSVKSDVLSLARVMQ